MTDSEKTIGEPIEDEELENVSGGLYIPDLNPDNLNKIERPANTGNMSIETLNIHAPGECTITIGEEDKNHAHKLMHKQLTGKDD